MIGLKREIDQIAKDKGIDPKEIIGALEEAMKQAARREQGQEKEIEAQFNEELGEIELFEFREVVEEITEGDLRDMVAVQPELSEHERRIIDGAFEFADHTLRQVMVPRVEVVSLPHDHDAAGASTVLAESGHTRVPVHLGDLDEVIGTVHVRDLVGAEGQLADHVRPVLVLPESVGCLDALHRMQEERQQMVVVIDEHGGTAGIVTVEDLLEELVGEIWDEADPDVRGVERNPDGSMLLEGSYPVHDLVDIGVDLPRGDYTTVGGLVLATLHRIPERGDRVRVGDWDLEVVEATTRRVRRVLLAPVEEPTGD